MLQTAASGAAKNFPANLGVVAKKYMNKYRDVFKKEFD